MARIDRNPPDKVVYNRPPVSAARTGRKGEAAVPAVIDEAKARILTGARETGKAFPVAAGVRGSGHLTEGQSLAIEVLLRAAKLMFSDPNSGDPGPNSEVG